MNFSVPSDPYSGIAVSAVTSNLIDLRDAFDWTLSTWTSAGTTSTITVQVTSDGTTADDITAASWSNWTVLDEPSAATVTAPILGVRWARLLRNPSVGSHQFRVNKHVR
jgi:hypothetical protein